MTDLDIPPHPHCWAPHTGLRVTRDLAALVLRHISTTGEHPVSVAELRNVLAPGSAPIYPAEVGHGPTCSLCAPNGDGHSSGQGGWTPEQSITTCKICGRRIIQVVLTREGWVWLDEDGQSKISAVVGHRAHHTHEPLGES